MDVQQLLQIVNTGGVVALLMLIVVGIQRGWYVPSRYYDDIVKDRNEWKELALTGTRAAERAVTVVERVRAADGR